MGALKRLIKPLQSRKVRVALATVVAAYAAEFGLDLSESLVMVVMGVGVSVILGIAIEDHGTKSVKVVTLPPLAPLPSPGRNGKAAVD